MQDCRVVIWTKDEVNGGTWTSKVSKKILNIINSMFVKFFQSLFLVPIRVWLSILCGWAKLEWLFVSSKTTKCFLT